MLFFFDTEYAYVLAEATRTLSLQDDDVHDFDDNLWLGYTVLRRGLSICEHTINVAPGSDRIGCSEGSQSVYIINDLQADTTFCDRPFVTAGPKARFYAGVPITTPANIRIGVYCVLDDKPRDGLSQVQVDFLSQMSKTVMSHLETIRERSELAMGSNMLTGLGDLLTTSTNNAIGGESHRPRPVSLYTQERSARSLPTRSNRSSRQADSAVSATPDTDRPATGDRVPSCDSPSTVATASTRGSPSLSLKANVDTQRLFHTAACLLRSTAEVDGSLFLDATIHAYGGAVGSASLIDENAAHMQNQGTTDLRRMLTNGKIASSAPCQILGTSVSNRCDIRPRLDMPEKFLETLLKKYPRGKVWSFISEEDLVPSTRASDALTHTIANDLNNNGSRTAGPVDEFNEKEQLQRLFPGVRGLCLVGMWDAIRERWYAGTFVWSYSHSRVFSKSTELVFLIAFCDLLMTEITRLESHLESKAKSDFISSISHELRSPLQGILCGIDLLSEPKSIDRPLISQIEQCSNTLLEIINHLLEFANINNLSGRRKSSLDQMEQHSALPGSMSQVLPETSSIRKITEQVCNSTFYSHCCVNRLPSDGSVSLILDVSADADVLTNTAVGAWKRICMNVINNALKYTKSGHVAVSLQQRGNPLVVLSVADTGCGMSSEFVNNRLFRPFEQENDMSPGTGLGMSLVGKLVESLGGEIQVQSQKSIGTKITISIPVDGVSLGVAGATIDQLCQGVRLSLLEPAAVNKTFASDSCNLLQAALKRSCMRLGAEITSSQVPDVQMTFESDVQAIDAQHASVPTILLCDNFVSALRLQKQLDVKFKDRHIQCIAQPYGPMRLSHAIKSATQPAANEDEAVELKHSAKESLDWTNGFTITHQSRVLPLSNFDTSTPMQSPKTVSPSNGLREDNHSRVILPEYGSTNEQLSTDSGAVKKKERQRTQDKESPISLLLVDDNVRCVKILVRNRALTEMQAVNLRVLVAYADKHGYPRLTATNGQEAIDTYAGNCGIKNADERKSNGVSYHVGKPMVILLDINMPVLDGFEAARRIRAFERSQGTYPAIIIAVTGLGSAEARQKAHASGMDLFLTKPVRPRDLTEVLAPIIASTQDLFEF